MNYLMEIKAFYDRLETNPLPSPAIALWHALMYIANKTGWQQEFGVALSVLVLRSGLNETAVKRARNKLVQEGYITWRSRSGNQSAIYSINSLVVQNNTKNEPQSEPQCEPQSEPQCEPQCAPINKQNKTKQNKICGVSKDTLRQTDVRLAIAKWNELSEFGIKPVKRVNSGTKRYDSLCARIREYGIEDVINAIDRIKVSDFLQGKNNRGWTITFGWFVLPSNFPKVLEGDYDNREGGGDDGSSGKAGADEKEWNPAEHWGRFD